MAWHTSLAPIPSNPTTLPSPWNEEGPLQPLPDGARGAQADHIGVGGVALQGGRRLGPAVGAVAPDPAQAVDPGGRAPAPAGAPGADGRREVQPDHGAGGREPLAGDGAVVAGDDPAVGLEQAPVHRGPLVGGEGATGPPEDLVQLDHRQGETGAELTGEGALSGRPGAENRETKGCGERQPGYPLRHAR